MSNRLADTASTYLRQHAENPVDWHEWGAEAFEDAKRRDVPVLLSVGYASCHWCHVMAHESFEDPATATMINRGFVPVKVDREQRPDIDAVYMQATQALTGQGGWPMTVFLTPDGDPFYAGTYFPPEPRSGLPAFRQVLAAVAETWQQRRGEVVSVADRVTAALASQASVSADRTISDDELGEIAERLLAGLDPVNGGFGDAPKFPPTMALEFLLRHCERTGDQRCVDAVTLTLDKMARGGIYDQLAGGFARYSVDAQWQVPHFEKMLDDNAQLLRLATHHARLTAAACSTRVAHEIGAFVLRDLQLPSGLFAASLDADTDGVEGATYRWSAAELREVVAAEVPEADINAVLDLFGISDGPGGGAASPRSDGHVLRLIGDADAQLGDSLFASVRAALLARRDQRPQPARDEIAVLRSNALAVTALVEAGVVLGEQAWIEAAEVAADALLVLFAAPDDPGVWRHSVLGSQPGPGEATLADYGSIATALLAFYQATGDASWMHLAVSTTDVMVQMFRDDDGRWYDTTAVTGTLPDDAGAFPGGPAITRPWDPTDNAAPSGASSAAEALLTASALTGIGWYRSAAEEILDSSGELAAQYPRMAGWQLAVREAAAAGPLQVAIAGPAGADRDALAQTGRRSLPGGAVIDIGIGGEPDRPLLADRPGVDGRAAAYVCRGFVCDAPVTDPAMLAAALSTKSSK